MASSFMQPDRPASKSIFISLVVKEIVRQVEIKLGTPVFYDFGHYTQVFRNIIGKDKGTTIQQKYPLVWLVMDLTEDRFGDVGSGIYGSAPAHILILNDTSQTATMPEREANVFAPILYPIYDEMINQIQISKYLSNSLPASLKHKKTNRYFWDGKDGDGAANLFGDFIDAIQIKNLVLNFNQQFCEQLNYFIP